MRESPSALGRGGVNLNVHGHAQHPNSSTTTAHSASKGVETGKNRPGHVEDTLNTQQIDALKVQLLEEESQADEEYANSQAQQGNSNDTTKQDGLYSHLAPPGGPLASETQLQGLFDETQFNNGFKKPALPGDKSEGSGNVHGHPSQSQSQDTPFFDYWRDKFLDDETQIDESQAEAPQKIVRQTWTFAGLHKDNDAETERESAKELEKRTEEIPSQAGETQFEAVKAHLLDSAVVDSQIDDTSKLDDTPVQEKTVLTENSAETHEAEGAETQGSDQVVLFPPGTSFSAGQGDLISESQSKSQPQNGIFSPVSNSIVTAESQDRVSQVLSPHTHVQTHVHDHQPGSDYLPPTAVPCSTTYLENQSHITTTNASAQSKIPQESVSASAPKQTKRKRSEADIKKLHGRAMDDWQRDSLGTASQTQENESGPRYGLAPELQDGESNTKRSRSSATQSGLDVDRTYNDNESGAVRLGLTQSQSQQLGGDLAVSQDQGLRSPSYDFARASRAVDNTSQIEPQTPATAKKNPFGKTGTGVPMGMSQVFAATQSSPLDPRFLPPSDGLRPSSPGIGLPSSPIARRGLPLKNTMSPEVEEYSPTHVTLTVASSFQPFDESTQPEAIRKAKAQKTKSPSPFHQEIPEYLRREVAEKFKGRTEPGEIRESQEELKRIRKQEEEAKRAQEAKRRYEEDDGMDVDRDNEIRIRKKKQELAAERNLREVGDMMGPRGLSNDRPVLDRIRQRASSERIIKKNPVREQRLLRQSAERASPPKEKKVEEVEVPASGEAAKAKEKTPPIKKSRKSRGQSEEHRDQSEGVDARAKQGSESQVIRSSSQAPRSSQQEVVVDSQNNISTQALTDHNSLSLEEVRDSYQPPLSTSRPKSRLNRTSSALLPTLGGEDVSAANGSSPPAATMPLTSSAHYLKNPNTTPRGSRSAISSNETAPEVVPETSPASKTPTPASKTASPAKLPFEDLDMVDDTPMQSFSDIRMTQEAPDPSDITPTKFRQKTYGKKSPVKKRPEQQVGRGARVLFSEAPTDDEEEVEVVKTGKRGVGRGAEPEKSKIARKTARFAVDGDEENEEPRGSPSPVAEKAAKGKPAPKSAKFVVEEDDDEEHRGSPNPAAKKAATGKGKPPAEPKTTSVARMSATPVEDQDDADTEASPSPLPKRSSRSKAKQAEQPDSVPVAKASDTPAEDEENVANADATAILQKFGRGRRKAKKTIPGRLPPTIVAPAEDSPQSSPILPAGGRRSARRQPSDLQNQAAPVIAPATSEDHDMHESSDDDAPIARAPFSKKRHNATIPCTSDTEMAHLSPAKNTNKLTGTPPFLPPLDDSDEGEDESVSSIRPSIETLTVCPRFVMNLPCKTDHSIDGLLHDETLRARSMDHRKRSTEIPSTASPGKSASSAESGEEKRSASAFTRPESTWEAHIPPRATGGRTHMEAASQQPGPQQASEYATTKSSLPGCRFSVESSPLSELASDIADELEEFHTANAPAAPSTRETSRESTAMLDAALMPPPQTVCRQLDFSAPLPPVEAPALPQTSNGKGKGKGNKRSASEGGVKSKKAAKTATDDTPSRSRRATRSVSLCAASADEDDEDRDTLVVSDTSRVAPTRRVGRQASRLSYAESPSTDGGDSAVAVARPVTRASRTPSPFTTVASGLQLGEANCNLFKGMAFAVSYKDGSREGVRDREEIERLILEYGGQLIEDFKDLFEKIDTSILSTAVSRANPFANLASGSASANTSMTGPSRRSSLPPQGQRDGGGKEHAKAGCELVLTKKAGKLGFVALIGDAPTRKSKFLQALALGMPCLNSPWIRYCVAQNVIMSWGIFMLGAGVSSKHGGMECSRFLPDYSATTARFEERFEARKKMLGGMGVLFLIVRSSKKKAEKDVLDARRELFLWLVRALGAREVRRVKDVKEANELLWDGGRGDGNGWDVVYVDDGTRLSTYRAQILGARWYGDDQESGADAGVRENEAGKDEDDELSEMRTIGKGNKAATVSASKSKPKTKTAPAGDQEMPDADAQEDDDTQPAEPKPEKKIRVVSDEFVVQSLILGALEDEDVVDGE